jgi:predicted metal-binding membrane protein
MCLLFTAGVMNPVWIIGLTAYVLIEKVTPHGEMLTKLAGLALIAGDVGLMLGWG